jgi:hypothetical protein
VRTMSMQALARGRAKLSLMAIHFLNDWPVARALYSLASLLPLCPAFGVVNDRVFLIVATA